MKFHWKFLSLKSALLCVLLSSLIYSGCSQYDYSSPLPGVLEVRLKTISNNIPFDPLNNFVITVSRIEAIREDGARALIFEDLNAIKRSSNVYNTLDLRARDSSLVLGATYIPPGRYIGIDVDVEPAASVVRDGYRIIHVERPDPPGQTLEFRSPYEVREQSSTLIKLAINLDSTLVQRANSYRFRPYYYISAIE
jgi:hypothetical protein